MLALDGNSAADWLVWIVDESKVGSYRNYQLMVVYDVSESEGLLQASPWLGTIKSQ